ncbi:beclin family protein [Schizosaccharomyces japonicus yFS275]|uniref:Beclin family protein n=1 Tax=Schizosaccharomyces japonicus (strain yFS275 / FY16936) TaxID=402676 RepID=B6JZ52_SCHJY|nr:beclin family protein [Schizosaccharomyces japonicus yFS275]EEB06820.1 beclin family protein [Schizosaccharomyces japonicus yFS275]
MAINGLVCQRCHSFLNVKTNDSEDLSKLKLLASRYIQDNAYPSRRDHEESGETSPSSEALAKTEKAMKETIQARIKQDNSTNGALTPILESFIMLPNDGEEPEELDDTVANNLLSRKMEIYNYIFDVLSEKTKIEHPLCSDCAELLTEEMDRQFETMKAEQEVYTEYHKLLCSRTVDDNALLEANEKIQKIQIEIDAKGAEVDALKTEEESLLQQLKQAEEEESQLIEENAGFWQDFNNSQLELANLQQSNDSIHMRFEMLSTSMENLQKLNIYSDIFYISHYAESEDDGSIATINGLRLGKLPSQRVSWSEINAAWGMTVLLMQVLAEKLHFVSEKFELKPYGSHSYILKKEVDASGNIKAAKLNLFSSGELKLFMHRRFDQGMVAFLDYMKHMGEFCSRIDPAMELPYGIEHDRIGGKCIRLAFNQDETWTKALKFMLTNVKFIEAYVSSQDKQQLF